MSPKQLKTVNIFISSAADVNEERTIAREVIQHLNDHPLYRDRLYLRTVSYEDFVPVALGISPQETVDTYMKSADQSDIFIGILWSRLGTPFIDDSTGIKYESGTAYEFAKALEAYEQTGSPRVLLYRSTKRTARSLDLDQAARVQQFFKRLDGARNVLNDSFRTFENAAEFRELLFRDLGQALQSLLEVPFPNTPSLVEELAKSEPLPDPTPRGIFVSYRRDDSAMAAGRLYDRLERDFGKQQLFMDVASIEPGDDFANEIDAAVSKCKVLLAVIGHRWVTIADKSGRRRLDNPNDFVRLEITSALKRNIRVIPVIVEDAPIPNGDDLPDELKPLARKNVVEIDTRYFHRDVDRLVETLVKVIG